MNKNTYIIGDDGDMEELCEHSVGHGYNVHTCDIGNHNGLCPLPARIPLTKGKFALVDREDFDFLSQWKWHYASRYAVRIEYKKEGKYKRISMHRLLMKVAATQEIDHINNNSLDNRKNNLRVVTHKQNIWNTSVRKGRQYKGVDFRKWNKKYRAAIQVNGKPKHLGYFDNAKDAARAYNKMAKKYFGEYAVLNKI